MSKLNSGPDALIAGPVTLINPFTVPPAETAQFLSHWRQSAGIMAAQPGLVRACLYRALDDAAEVPFVNIAQWDSGIAFDQARANPDFRAEGQRVLDAPQLHIAGRPGVYQIALVVHPSHVREPTRDDVRDHYSLSQPAEPRAGLITVPDAEANGPVTMINPFTVPPAQTEQFLRHWRQSAPIMAAQPGAIRAHLYRALDDAAEVPFVNVAEFDSPTAHGRAWTDPEWRASMQRMQDAVELHATPRPALYRKAIEAHPRDASPSFT